MFGLIEHRGTACFTELMFHYFCTIMTSCGLCVQVRRVSHRVQCKYNPPCLFTSLLFLHQVAVKPLFVFQTLLNFCRLNAEMSYELCVYSEHPEMFIVSAGEGVLCLCSM